MTIAKTLLFGVDVPVHLHGVAAKLGHSQYAFIRLRSAQGFYVDMPALKIATSLVKPARSMVHQAGWVIALHPVRS